MRSIKNLFVNGSAKIAPSSELGNLSNLGLVEIDNNSKFQAVTLNDKRSKLCSYCEMEAGIINSYTFKLCRCCKKYSCDNCIKLYELELFPTLYSLPDSCNNHSHMISSIDDSQINTSSKLLICSTCHAKCLIPSVLVRLKTIQLDLKETSNLYPKNLPIISEFPQLTLFLTSKDNTNLNIRYNSIKQDQKKCYFCDTEIKSLLSSVKYCNCCGLYLCQLCTFKGVLDFPTKYCVISDKRDNYLKAGSVICKDCKLNFESYWMFQLTKDSYVLKRTTDIYFENPKYFEDIQDIDISDKNDFLFKKTKNLMSYLVGPETEMVVVILNEIARRSKLKKSKLYLIYYISKYYELRLKLQSGSNYIKKKICRLELNDEEEEYLLSDEDRAKLMNEESYKNKDLLEESQIELLHDLGQYCGFAEMMYVLNYPRTSQEDISPTWYLSKLAKLLDYNLLYVRADSTYYPDSKVAAAFSLLVSRNISDDCNNKKAILIIRGTVTTSDWDINLKEKSISYKYFAGKMGEKSIEGKVHEGMYNSALAILETNNMKIALFELLSKGYTVTIVGHSLGAGAGAVVLMEMKKYLLEQKHQQQDMFYNKENPILEKLYCVGFGVPPVISVEIAEALYDDQHMKSVVNGEDAICRLNKNNHRDLAAKLPVLIPYAEAQLSQNTREILPKWVNSLRNKKYDEVNNNKENIDGDSKEVQKLYEDDDDSSLESYVVPGVIFHFYQRPGLFKWRLQIGKYDLKTLNRIYPMEIGLHQHKMQKYTQTLRSMKMD